LTTAHAFHHRASRVRSPTASDRPCLGAACSGSASVLSGRNGTPVIRRCSMSFRGERTPKPEPRPPPALAGRQTCPSRRSRKSDSRSFLQGGPRSATRLRRELTLRTDPQRIAEIPDPAVNIDAPSAPSRAAAIPSGLGFSAADQRCLFGVQAGWRMRVAARRHAVRRPRPALLDEPTNYLDPKARCGLRPAGELSATVSGITTTAICWKPRWIRFSTDRGKLTLIAAATPFREQRATREMLDASKPSADAGTQRLACLRRPFQAKARKPQPRRIASRCWKGEAGFAALGNAVRARDRFPRPRISCRRRYRR